MIFLLQDWLHDSLTKEDSNSTIQCLRGILMCTAWEDGWNKKFNSFSATSLGALSRIEMLHGCKVNHYINILNRIVCKCLHLLKSSMEGREEWAGGRAGDWTNVQDCCDTLMSFFQQQKETLKLSNGRRSSARKSSSNFLMNVTNFLFVRFKLFWFQLQARKARLE